MFKSEHVYSINLGTELLLKQFNEKYQGMAGLEYEKEVYTNNIKELESIGEHLIPSLYLAIIKNRGNFTIERYSYEIIELGIREMIILEISDARFTLYAD